MFGGKSRRKSMDVEISGPSAARHEGHVGFDDKKGFEARNLPPEWAELFQGINATLRSMGVKGITKKEAIFLLKAAAQGLPGLDPDVKNALDTVQTSKGASSSPQPNRRASMSFGLQLSNSANTAPEKVDKKKNRASVITGPLSVEEFVAPVNTDPLAVENEQLKQIIRTLEGTNRSRMQRMAEELQETKKQNEKLTEELHNMERRYKKHKQRSISLEEQQQIVSDTKIAKLAASSSRSSGNKADSTSTASGANTSAPSSNPKSSSTRQGSSAAAPASDKMKRAYEKQEEQISSLRSEITALNKTISQLKEKRDLAEELEEARATIKLLEAQVKSAQHSARSNPSQDKKDNRHHHHTHHSDKDLKKSHKEKTKDKDKDKSRDKKKDKEKDTDKSKPPSAPSSYHLSTRPTEEPKKDAPKQRPVVPSRSNPKIETSAIVAPLAPAAPPPSKAPVPPPQANKPTTDAARPASFLSQIQQGKELKTVEATQKSAPTAEGGILGVLAKAILDRRAALKEDEDVEGDDGLLWED